MPCVCVYPTLSAQMSSRRKNSYGIRLRLCYDLQEQRLLKDQFSPFRFPIARSEELFELKDSDEVSYAYVI